MVMVNTVEGLGPYIMQLCFKFVTFVFVRESPLPCTEFASCYGGRPAAARDSACGGLSTKWRNKPTNTSHLCKLAPFVATSSSNLPTWALHTALQYGVVYRRTNYDSHACTIARAGVRINMRARAEASRTRRARYSFPIEYSRKASVSI